MTRPLHGARPASPATGDDPADPPSGAPTRAPRGPRGAAPTPHRAATLVRLASARRLLASTEALLARYERLADRASHHRAVERHRELEGALSQARGGATVEALLAHVERFHAALRQAVGERLPPPPRPRR